MGGVDVAVTDLRANLSHWLASVRDGDEVVVTEYGRPVARICRVDTTATLDRLAAEGVIAPARRSTRPTATGRTRPRPRRSVADLVSDQRD